MLNFNICKITKSILTANNSNDNRDSLLVDKFAGDLKDIFAYTTVIDEDSICLTNLWQLIITVIACLLMLFTGLYQCYNLSKIFSRYRCQPTGEHIDDDRYYHYDNESNLNYNNDNDADDNCDDVDDGANDLRSQRNSHKKDYANIRKISSTTTNNYSNTRTTRSNDNNRESKKYNSNAKTKNSNNNNDYTTASSTSTCTTQAVAAETIEPTTSILFKFHNIRCTTELLLLAINSLELCKSLLPLPFYAVTFWSTAVNAMAATHQGYSKPSVASSLTSTTFNANTNRFAADELNKFHLILHSPPFAISNSVASTATTLILIAYHRILEQRNASELLYLSLPLEAILAIIRIYQINSNIPSYFDLEAFLNWSTSFCLLALATIDGYILYKQRFKIKRASKKMNEQAIGYKHSIATFYSKILFFWITPFLWHGYREPLEQEDLGHLREEDSARAYYDQFLLIYKTSAKKNKNPSLWLCYLKSSWKWFTLGGCLKLLGDLSALIGPLSIHQIVDYIEYEYNRSVLNGTSIVYNMHNNFGAKQSFGSSNTSNRNDINRMNLFTQTNLQIIWSMLRYHSKYRKLDNMHESYMDANGLLPNNATHNSSLSDSDVNAIGIDNEWLDALDQGNANASSFTDLFGSQTEVIRPLYSMFNGVSDYLLKVPSLNGFSLWANITWAYDGTNGLFDSQIKSMGSFHHYYYYPNWSEFLSNGWIIAWIVLISAISQGGLSQASTHLLNMTGIRIKTSLQGLIYRKTLLLSSSCIETNGNKCDGRKENPVADGRKSSDDGKYIFSDARRNDSVNSDGRINSKLNGSKTMQSSKRDAGSITNLMTEDSLNVMSFFWIAHYVWAIPLKIGLVMYLLYLKLGISAIIGSFVCILTMTPLQFLIGKAMSKNSEISAQCTDERLRKINDIFLGIKLIKLNAWERVYKEKINAVRQKELKYLNKDSFFWTAMTFLTHLSSVLITFVTLAVYVGLQTSESMAEDEDSNKSSGFGFEFTASRLFSALALFNQLTVPLLIFPITVPIIISAIVSTRRLERFLQEPEVQREFEGIKHMARILSKSDAALDMYEIKIPLRAFDSENCDANNSQISPITESTPTSNTHVDLNQVAENESETTPQSFISHFNFDSVDDFDEDDDIRAGYYAAIPDESERDAVQTQFSTELKEKLLSQFDPKPRKSICDEIDEFDREYNNTVAEVSCVKNKSLTPSASFDQRYRSKAEAAEEQQQHFNVNNNNNDINYTNDCHQNGNNNNENNCYDIKIGSCKELQLTAANTVSSSDGKQDEKMENKTEYGSCKEYDNNKSLNGSNNTIRTNDSVATTTTNSTDSPRNSAKTKLKREYNNNSLPKKRRNKDLIRSGGGGSIRTQCSTSNRSGRSRKLPADGNENIEYFEVDTTSNAAAGRSSGADTEDVSAIANAHPNQTSARNSRKLVSGRESFQFQIADNIAVSISNGVFSWDNCKVSLRVDELNIPRGKLTIIVGKNGSGKTSLISALLREMHQVSGDVSWNKYSTIAYVPQTPWLLNASIRDNILFGESFRPKRYEKVLEACALKPDINLMPDGDMTVIGERGINLSGGQKQRINIARSLYSSGNVVMMDDPLSSLDNEVAKHVFQNSIKRMLLKTNRTVVLVTQKLQLLSSASYIIVMNDCCVQSAGNYEQIQKENPNVIMEWNSILAKGNEKDQISPGKTARERWRLFKNISRIGLLRPQDTEQEQLLSNQSLYMQTKRRSSIFGSRHLIYDIPLPIDECQNDDIIIKRRGSRRSIILMGLGNAISGSSMTTNCDYKQTDGRVGGLRRKNSVLRVKSLQPEVKHFENRIPVTRNISSPGRFLDTKARTADGEFKPKTGFRQFLSRMSSRKSNLGTKLHRPISASNSIQSISEESHTNLQRVELSCSSEFIDDESVQDLNDEEHNDNSTQNNDDERKYGEIPLQIYMLYLKSCGLPIVLIFFATALIWQCLRVYTDVWLRYWTEMDPNGGGAVVYNAAQQVTTPPSAFNFNTDVNGSASSFNSFRNCFNDSLKGRGSSSITRAFTEFDKKADDDNLDDLQSHHNSVEYCFNMYTIITSICILMSLISIPAGQKAGCNAREKLHEQLLESLLAKPLHFFQITPLGKIINRFSNDMSIIDKKIAPTSQRLLQFTLLCLCAILINLAITPWFLILTIPICFAYYIIQKFYRCSSRELQRLENITSSPVISHFNETIQGVTTIRAYSQESRFTETLFRRLEANTIAFIMLNTSNRWLGIALDYLGGIIVFIAIITALLAAAIAKGKYKLENGFHSNAAEQFSSHDRYYNNNDNQHLSSSMASSSSTNNLNLNSTTSSLSSSSSESAWSGFGINFGYNRSHTQNIYYGNEESPVFVSFLSPSPSLVGLAINYTLLVPIYLNWVVKLLSDMEMYVGSVERVAYYQQKLNEKYSLWMNSIFNRRRCCYPSKGANQHQHDEHNTKHCHHHHNHQAYSSCTDKLCRQQQYDDEHHRYTNCEVDDERTMYCQHSNSKNLVSLCSKYDSSSKQMQQKIQNEISDNMQTCKTHPDASECSNKCSCCYRCCCCDHQITHTNDLQQVIYDKVPISWPQRGDIEFVNITLRYQGQQQQIIIKDLSLKIPAGQKIGICGRTGSGKSTLALSLFSVMEVIRGKILIDGININSIHPDEVRSRLSIIPQDVHLFSDTIRENLDPRGHYSDLDLWNCLELAQLKDVVTRMPLGLDTEIVEGAFNLSAGQRQLFCLARAVLRGSVCLVLDEATSSLDAITEKALMDAAHNAFKGRTILTIAHRLSTLLTYDRIIVLENGKIIEDGRPDELKAIPNGKFITMLQSAE